MSARGEILGRIRAARPLAVPAAPVAYRRAWDADRATIVARFCERLTDYNVTLLRGVAADIGVIASAQCARRGISALVVPADLPVAWRPALPVAVEDAMLDHEALNACDGVMTASLLAIAETGTVVLDGGAGQGRRALTLLPDYHLCVVCENDIVGILPEAMERIQASVAAGRPITFFSGPSATADIELDRVAGVHGPRTLDVIVVP